ncbi:MAG: cobalamin B12-binding domain-containing protein [Candidatus Korobacteraceae bacterium]
MCEEASSLALSSSGVSHQAKKVHPRYIFAYGLRILSACLKHIGCRVQLVFLPRILGEIYPDRVLDQIVQLSAGSALIGISVMSDDFENAVRITQRLKRSLLTPVIWGGMHPTLQPKECLEHADIVCIGEGEETLVESRAEDTQRRRLSNGGRHLAEAQWTNNRQPATPAGR